MTKYPRYDASVMQISRARLGPFPLENPRVVHESWLAINFVPPEYYDELELRLEEIQQQAVHIAALQLRKAGMAEAADLIDPGDGSVSSSPS